MGKYVILVLAALVVLAGVVAAGVTSLHWFSDLAGKRHEAPRLMIVTTGLLRNQANLQDEDKKNDATLKVLLPANFGQGAGQQTAAGKNGGSGGATGKPAPTGQAAASPDEKNKDGDATSSESLKMVVQAMNDALAGRVAQTFQDSNRFRLIPSAKVVDAMQQYAGQHGLDVNALLSWMPGAAKSKSTSPKGPSAAQVNAEAALFTRGVPEVGRKVGADYVLVVSMDEPHLAMDYIPPQNGQTDRIVMIARPQLNVEIFQPSGQIAYRFNRQIDKPIVETVVGYAGIPANGVLLSKYNTLEERIAEAGAQQALAWTLDKIAPARIERIQGDRFIINRGTNDGVAQGAVYEVQREVGDAVHEGGDGADLGRLRVHAGSLFIQDVQERLSTATAADGAKLLKDDIVLVQPQPKPAAPGAGATAAPGGPPPLNVAVDHIRLAGGGDTDASRLVERVSATLAEDPRITVLARTETANLTREQALNQRAAGDYESAPGEGATQSAYLVDGDCTRTSSHKDSTVSVGGVSRTIAGAAVSATRCDLRANALGGRLIGAASGSGGSVDDAATQAARNLVAKLLAASGARSAAPAPTAPPAPSAREPAVATAPAKRPPVARRPAETKSSTEDAIHF